MEAPTPSPLALEHFWPAPTTEMRLRVPLPLFSKTKMPVSLKTCEYVETVMFYLTIISARVSKGPKSKSEFVFRIESLE